MKWDLPDKSGREAGRKGWILPSSAFCSFHSGCQYTGGNSPTLRRATHLLSPLIQVLFSSGNTPTDTTRDDVYLGTRGPLKVTRKVNYMKTHSEEGHVKTEAETRAIQLQSRNTKECQEPAQGGRRLEDFFPWDFRERVPADTMISDFKPPELSKNRFLLFYTTWIVVLCQGGNLCEETNTEGKQFVNASSIALMSGRASPSAKSGHCSPLRHSNCKILSGQGCLLSSLGPLWR